MKSSLKNVVGFSSIKRTVRKRSEEQVFMSSVKINLLHRKFQLWRASLKTPGSNSCIVCTVILTKTSQ